MGLGVDGRVEEGVVGRGKGKSTSIRSQNGKGRREKSGTGSRGESGRGRSGKRKK